MEQHTTLVWTTIRRICDALSLSVVWLEGENGEALEKSQVDIADLIMKNEELQMRTELLEHTGQKG